jgi:hypothetical protein
MQEEIRNEMQARHLTSAGLADLLRQHGVHVHDSTVRAWAAGRSMPGLRTGMALRDIFGWSTKKLETLSGYRD